MSLNHRHASDLTATVLVAMLTLLPGLAAAGQRRGPSGGGSGGGSHGGHTPSGGSERVGTATPRSGGNDGATRTGGSAGSDSPRPAPTPARASGDSDDKNGDSGGDTTYSRPRNGAPIVGKAEPRDRGHGSGGPTTIIVPGGWYYPWGYGGYGFAGYYGGYDPWVYDEPYYPPSDEGAVRLKVKPRDASVFVDGSFAGEVDEFDGVFQRLSLDSGPHRIEIGLDGYETLSFEIRVVPDRTITYEGELRHLRED